MIKTTALPQHESQALLIQSMLDASMHGILMLQPMRDEFDSVSDFSILAANAAVEKHIGYPVLSTMGKRMSEIFPNYIHCGFFNAYMTALQTREVQRLELYYEDTRLQGWFDLGVAPHEDSIVVTFVNISDNKNYQQAVHDYAEKLTTVVDTSQSGMFLFSPIRNEEGEIIDFIFTMANRSLAAYVGQQPETIIGGKGSTWFPAYKTNGLFEYYKESFESGKSERFEFHYNGDEIDVWLDIMTTKLKDELLVTFTDYTAVKKLQLQLEHTVKELRRSNTYLEEFAYAASHDLQEPLRKIQFYSNKIKHQLENKQINETMAVVERMDFAANRMRLLIDDLLAYSQVNSEHEKFSAVNLQTLISEILNDLDTLIKETKAEVNIGQLPVVNGDRRQLYQLFQNLLTNALKYCKRNSSPDIIISAEVTDGKNLPVDLSAYQHNRRFHLVTVADKGLGFEHQYAKKIFHIFQRLHGKNEYPGTGVGLAIVEKVVENHHGHVWAEAEPGEGARFFILLPAE
jgi:signal transduction histidine kinase